MATKEADTTTKKQLRYFVRRYYQMQKQRIAFGNEISALEKEQDGVPPEIQEIYKDQKAVERKMSRFMGDIVEEHYMWDWFKDIKGIGHTLASALIAEIDIEKAQHPSSVWKYAGFHVICPKCTWEKDETYETKDGGERIVTSKYPVDISHDGTCPKCGKPGVAAKRRKGVKANWNTFLQTVCWKIGESFVKTNGEYRNIYDQSRKKYEDRDTSDGHKHAMAKRRTVKHFLADMHTEWRERAGLPTSEPYPHKDE